jgi:hypothetical protein
MVSGIVLVAIEDPMLRAICEEILGVAGWPVIPVENPVDLIRFPELVRCDAVIVDGSRLGRDTLLAGGLIGLDHVIGIGTSQRPIKVTLDLPFTARDLVDAIGVRPPLPRVQIKAASG